MDEGDFGISPFSFTASGPFNVLCTEGPGVEAVLAVVIQRARQATAGTTGTMR